MRVFELAKTLKVPSKELIARLKKMGVKVSSHMSALDAGTVERVKKEVGASPKPAAPKQKVPSPAPSPSKEEADQAEPSKSVLSKTERPAPQQQPAPAAPKEKAPSPLESGPGYRPAPRTERQAAQAEKSKAEPQTRSLKLNPPVTVKELAEKLFVSPSEVIKHLLGMKILATINQLVSAETVEKVLQRYGCRLEKPPTPEEQLEAMHAESDPARLEPRPPVVTLMGHVDHGKTSILDWIQKSRVVEGESGSITQHIGAYRVNLPNGTITFLDTPGHEAFTAMRARGADVTDIVVLVIAADDGIMPQTEEAIDHALAAEAAIVVALNKVDKPTADVERVKRQLAEKHLTPEDWGGKTIVVPVSARTGQGMNQLLEMLLLEAELLELKADPDRPARGVVLEGKLTKGGGPVAHVLIQSGTLRVGDVVVLGKTWGKVRAMLDARGHRLESAGPSTPVEVLGIQEVPQAGDVLLRVPDDRQARDVVRRRREESAGPATASGRRAVTLEEFHKQLEAGEVKNLNLILKADVQGSLEALKDSLAKITSKEAGMKFLHTGVGAINGSDILLAEASKAVVVGFHVRMTPEAERLAKEEGVDVRFYEVIYRAVSDIRAALEGLLEPKRVEQVIGQVKVLQAFKLSKGATVAGCQVVKGKVIRNAHARVFRGKERIFEGRITSLKRFKEDAREVAEGYQCGLSLSGWNDVQPEDTIEIFEVQQVAQRL